MVYKDTNGVINQIGKAFYKDANSVIHQLGRGYYKDANGVVYELKLSLNVYQKYASADLLKPKYSPSHGLYVGYKTTGTGRGTQPYYSTDLINWTMFTNTYYEDASSYGGSMGEVFPMQGKLFVKGTYNGSWNYAGRNYLFRYDSPTSAYTQVAQATSDGSIYPIIDKGYGFYTSYTGQSGAKLSKVSDDPLTWIDMTYRAAPRGAVASDGKIFVVDTSITTEFGLIEIDAIAKTEKVMYAGTGYPYATFSDFISNSLCDDAGHYYWGLTNANGHITKMSKGTFAGNRYIISFILQGVTAPIKMMQYSPQLGVYLIVDVNNKVYECPGYTLDANSICTLVDANLGTTINSIAVGNNEFIVQSNLGIFVLK